MRAKELRYGRGSYSIYRWDGECYKEQFNGECAEFEEGATIKYFFDGESIYRNEISAKTHTRMSGSSALKSALSMGTTQTSTVSTAIAKGQPFMKRSAGTLKNTSGSRITRHSATLERTGPAKNLQVC